MATGSQRIEGMSVKACHIITTALEDIELLARLAEEATTVQAAEVHFGAISIRATVAAEDLSRDK